jgi:hypothetical protein
MPHDSNSTPSARQLARETVQLGISREALAQTGSDKDSPEENFKPALPLPTARLCRRYQDRSNDETSDHTSSKRSRSSLSHSPPPDGRKPLARRQKWKEFGIGPQSIQNFTRNEEVSEAQAAVRVRISVTGDLSPKTKRVRDGNYLREPIQRKCPNDTWLNATKGQGSRKALIRYLNNTFPARANSDGGSWEHERSGTD